MNSISTAPSNSNPSVASPMAMATMAESPGFSSPEFSNAIRYGRMHTAFEILKYEKHRALEKDSDNVTPLHWACLNNELEMVKLLIEAGAPLDVKSIDTGSTPLAWACVKGNTRVVHFLLQRGANLSDSDKLGYHAIHHAAMNDNLALLYYLCEVAHVDVNLRDAERHSPLIWASYFGHERIVQFLLKRGAHLDLTDGATGATALHWAANRNHRSVTELLIKAGADLTLADSEGRSPLDEAKLRGSANAAWYIQQCLANPSLTHTGSAMFRTFWFTYPAAMIVLFTLMSCYFDNVVIGVLLASVLTAVSWVKFAYLRRIPRKIGPDPAVVSLAFGVYLVSHIFGFTKLTDFAGFLANPLKFWHGWGAAAWIIWWTRAIHSDPGVIPRDTATPEEIISHLEKGSNLDEYCLTCVARRPLRAKHCATMNQCVAKFDHYCPWLQNDVGAGNHKMFMGMVLLITPVAFYHLYLIYEYLVPLWPEQDFLLPNKIALLFMFEPLAILDLTYHVLFSLWLILLLGGQFRMIATNMTTNETLKRSESGGYGSDNPFDLGFVNNIRDYLNDSVNWKTVFDYRQIHKDSLV